MSPGGPSPLARQAATRNLLDLPGAKDVKALASADAKAGPGSTGSASSLMQKCKGEVPPDAHRPGFLGRVAAAARSAFDRPASPVTSRSVVAMGSAQAPAPEGVQFSAQGKPNSWARAKGDALAQDLQRKGILSRHVDQNSPTQAGPEKTLKWILGEAGYRADVTKALFIANYESRCPEKAKFNTLEESARSDVKSGAVGDTVGQLAVIDEAASNFFISAMTEPGPSAIPVRNGLVAAHEISKNDLSAAPQLVERWQTEFSRCVYAEIADHKGPLNIPQEGPGDLSPFFEKAMERMAKKPEYAPQAF